MSRTAHVFCTKLSGVYLRRLVESLHDGAHGVRIVDSTLDLDMESPTWQSISLVCADGSRPIEIEHYIGGLNGSAVEDESGHLLDMLKVVEESMEKREVVVYLRMARELYVVKVPDDGGKETTETAMHCANVLASLGEGVIYVEGDGFYGKGGMLMPLAKS